MRPARTPMARRQMTNLKNNVEPRFIKSSLSI
jgi:hypothetical protein